MTFPPPKTESPAQRFEEASAAARDALEGMIAAANEAGWGTEEITAALLKAAQFMSDATKKIPIRPTIPQSATHLPGRNRLVTANSTIRERRVDLPARTNKGSQNFLFNAYLISAVGLGDWTLPAR